MLVLPRGRNRHGFAFIKANFWRRRMDQCAMARASKLGLMGMSMMESGSGICPMAKGLYGRIERNGLKGRRRSLYTRDNGRMVADMAKEFFGGCRCPRRLPRTSMVRPSVVESSFQRFTKVSF